MTEKRRQAVGDEAEYLRQLQEEDRRREEEAALRREMEREEYMKEKRRVEGQRDD